MDFAPLAPALYATYPVFLARSGEREEILRRNGFMLRANIAGVEEYAAAARRYAKGLSSAGKRDLLQKVAELEGRLPAMRKELAECEQGLPDRERVRSVVRRYLHAAGGGQGRFELDVVYKDGRAETLDWDQVIGIGKAPAAPPAPEDRRDEFTIWVTHAVGYLGLASREEDLLLKLLIPPLDPKAERPLSHMNHLAPYIAKDDRLLAVYLNRLEANRARYGRINAFDAEMLDSMQAYLEDKGRLAARHKALSDAFVPKRKVLSGVWKDALKGVAKEASAGDRRYNADSGLWETFDGKDWKAPASAPAR